MYSPLFFLQVISFSRMTIYRFLYFDKGFSDVFLLFCSFPRYFFQSMLSFPQNSPKHTVYNFGNIRYNDENGLVCPTSFPYRGGANDGFGSRGDFSSAVTAFAATPPSRRGVYLVLEVHTND